MRLAWEILMYIHYIRSLLFMRSPVHCQCVYINIYLLGCYVFLWLLNGVTHELSHFYIEVLISALIYPLVLSRYLFLHCANPLCEQYIECYHILVILTKRFAVVCYFQRTNLAGEE